MDMSSILRDFPAENISRVELIQQPGAEYDAEGSGPLINIVLKRNVKLGTNGSVKLYTGYDNAPEYGISGAVSSYKNKINWQVSGGYRQASWRDDLYLERNVKDVVYDQATVSPYSPVTMRLNGGLYYYLNEDHTFGIDAGIINKDSERISSNSTGIIGATSSDVLLTNNSFDRNRKTVNVNPYYKYDDEKNKIMLDFNFVDYNNDNVNNLFSVGDNSIAFNDQRYIQNGNYQIFTYKADYKRTVNDDFNWMLGAKFSDVSTDSELQSYSHDENDSFVFDKAQSNRFLVDEDILALYTKVVKNWKPWSVSAGLRWEDSNTTGTSTNPVATRSRNTSKLFPSASVSRSITDNLGANVSYSYRILRPSYNSLNAFVYYYDPFTFEEGNPNLKPEFTHSFKFGLTFNDQPFFSVSHKRSTDALFEIVSQNDLTAQTSRSVINLATRNNWNLQAFAPISFLDNLDGFSGFIVNYNEFESEELDPKLDLSKWSMTWYTSLEYEFPWEINSELTGYYITGGLQGQIEHDWLAGLSLAFSKKFMEDKLKVNVGVGEVLNRKFVGRIAYDNIDAVITNDWSRQDVYLQLTYNFGSKFNKKVDKKNSSKDIEERIKDNN